MCCVPRLCAGSGGARRIVLTLALLAGFRDKVDIFAFEARPDKAAELRREALRRESTAAYAARRLHVYAAAAGDRPGQLRFAHCGGTTDWMVVVEGEEPRKGCKIKYEVPVSSLDELERTGVLKNRRMAYVKVDVEGNELAVAKGMQVLTTAPSPSLSPQVTNWRLLRACGACSRDGPLT